MIRTDAIAGTALPAEPSGGSTGALLAAGAIEARRHRRSVLLIVLLVAALVMVGVASLASGAVSLHFEAIMAGLFRGPFATIDTQADPSVALGQTILWALRLPRWLMAVIVGAALGAGGVAAQGVFRNPLAEPALMGVSTGAGLFAAAGLVWTPSVVSALVSGVGESLVVTAFAFAGGLAASALTVTLARVREASQGTATLVLAGVAVNALCASLLGLVLFYSDDSQLRRYTFWTLGSLNGATWPRLAVGAPLVALPLVLLWRVSPALDVMQLGDAAARHTGVDTSRVTRAVAVAVALSVGAAVAMCGIISFIGLVVPHLARKAIGPRHRPLLIASALGGGVLLATADLTARTLAAPAELPVGVITALCGAPFLAALLVRGGRS